MKFIYTQKHVTGTISDAGNHLRAVKTVDGRQIIQRENPNTGDFYTLEITEVQNLAKGSDKLRTFLEANTPDFWQTWKESPTAKKIREAREARERNQGWSEPVPVADVIVREFPTKEFGSVAIRSILVKDETGLNGTRIKTQIMFREPQYRTKEASEAVLADLKRLGVDPSKEKTFNAMEWKTLSKAEIYDAVKDFTSDRELFDYIENNV